MESFLRNLLRRNDEAFKIFATVYNLAKYLAPNRISIREQNDAALYELTETFRRW